MCCCFTHEGVCTQVNTQVTLMGLIWLRHTRARMGHQVVASPTVRYILHGGRNRSVAVNSLSLVGIWETCTLLLKHPPHPEREHHSHVGVKARVDKQGGSATVRYILHGRAATLRGSKLAKWQLSRRQRLNHSKALGLAKRGGHRLLTNHQRTPSGAVRSLSKASHCHQPREDQLHPCQPDQSLQPVDQGHDEPEDDDEAACGYGALRPPLLPFPAGW